MKIIYELSNIAIKSELKKGNEIEKKQEILVNLSELSQEKRELLINHGSVREHQINFDRNSVLKVDKPGLQGLFDKLEEKEKVRQQGEYIMNVKDNIHKLIKEKTSNLDGIGGHIVSGELGYNITIRWGDNHANTFDILDKSVEDIDKFYDIAKKVLSDAIKKAIDLQDKKATEKEEQERQREEDEQQLLSWALKNGSDLLKKQIKKGFDWKPKARNEYLNTLQPSGWVELNYYYKKIPNSQPSEKAMEAFEAAEALCNGTTIKDPGVWILLYEQEPDEYGDYVYPGEIDNYDLEPDEDGDIQLSIAKVTLFAPDNSTRVVMKPII